MLQTFPRYDLTLKQNIFLIPIVELTPYIGFGQISLDSLTLNQSSNLTSENPTTSSRSPRGKKEKVKRFNHHRYFKDFVYIIKQRSPSISLTDLQVQNFNYKQSKIVKLLTNNHKAPLWCIQTTVELISINYKILATIKFS